MVVLFFGLTWKVFVLLTSICVPAPMALATEMSACCRSTPAAQVPPPVVTSVQAAEGGDTLPAGSGNDGGMAVRSTAEAPMGNLATSVVPVLPCWMSTSYHILKVVPRSMPPAAAVVGTRRRMAQ